MPTENQGFSFGVDLEGTEAQLNKLKSLLNDTANGFNNFTLAATKLNKDTGELDVTLRGISDTLELVNKTFTIGLRGGGLAETSKTFKDLKETAQSLINPTTESIKATRNLQSQLEALTATTQKAVDQLNQLAIAQINNSKRIADAEEASVDRRKKAQDAIIKKKQDALIKDQQNKDNSSALDSLLRGQFTAPVGVSTTDTARLEIAISRIVEAAAKGKTNVDSIINSLASLQTTGQLGFDNLDAKTKVWLRSLILADEALNKLNKQNSATDLQQRIQNAADIAKNIQQQFSQPLAVQGIDTGKIDTAIAKLQTLVRVSGISQQRFNEVLQASLNPADLLKLDLSKQENQIVGLIQRIRQLHNDASQGANAAANAEQKFLGILTQATPLLNQVVSAFTQQFGQLNPSQFIQLQTIFNQIFAQLKTGTVTVQQLQQAFANLQSGNVQLLNPQQGSAAQTQLLRIQQLFQQTGQAGAEAGNSIFLSWRNVIRLFEVQVLHQIFGQFITDLRQSFDEATKFSIKIAEIRTISQDNQLSTAQWSKELVNLSNSFGLPILDVTKAAYDAISNQVTRGAETFSFLTTTLQFARVTVSSATDAVNLLTSATKSYGEQNLTTQRAAEVLFKTIDLGRVTASELANTYGRVAQLAAQAGISFNELNAAIATLSIQGVKASETFTLINNVALKLLKPTDEMKKLFREWGVSSGEAAIQTFGFVGVLRRLQDELEKGGLSRLGELESNIRAIRGAAALVNKDAFASFEDNLQKITNSSKDFANAIDIVFNSAGVKLEQQIQTIKNLFNTEIGQTFINSILSLTQPFGGLANLVKVTVDIFKQFLEVLKTLIDSFVPFFKAIGSIASTFGITTENIKPLITAFIAYELVIVRSSFYLGLLTTAQAAYSLGLKGTLSSIINYVANLRIFNLVAQQTATTTTAAAASTTAFGTAQTAATAKLVTFNLALGVAAAGLAALAFAYLDTTGKSQAFIDSLNQQVDAITRVNRETDIQKLDKQQQESVETFKKNNDERLKSVNQLVARVTSQYNLFVDNIKKVDKVGIDIIRNQAAVLGVSLDESERTLKDFTKEIEKSIETAKRNINSIKEKNNVRGFEQSLIGTDDITRADLVIARVKDLKALIEQTTNIKIINQDTIIAAQTALSGFGGVLNNLANIANNTPAILSPELIEQARKKYDEINKILETAIDHQRTIINQAQQLINTLEVKEDQRKFDRSIAGLNPLQSAQAIIDRANQLETKAVSLFNIGNIDQARKLFDEVDTILDNLFKKQEDLARQSDTNIRKLKEQIDTRTFERLIKQNQSSTLVFNRVDQLKAESIKLFDTGNFEEARSKLDEIDKLLEKIFDRQLSFRQKAEKLGVVFTTPISTSRQDQNDKDRLNLEESIRQRALKNAQTVDNQLKQTTADRLKLETTRVNVLQDQYKILFDFQRKNYTDLINLEQIYTRQQENRLRIVIEAETKIKAITDTATKLNQDVQNINNLQANAAKDLRDSQATVKNNLNTLSEFAKERTQNIPQLPILGSTSAEKIAIADLKASLEKLSRTIAEAQKNPSTVNLQAITAALAATRDATLEFNKVKFGTLDPSKTPNVQSIEVLFQKQLEILNKTFETLTKQNTAQDQLKQADESSQRIQESIDNLKQSLPTDQQKILEDTVRSLQTPQLNFAEKLNASVDDFNGQIKRLVDILKSIPDFGNIKAPNRAFGGPIGSDTGLFWGAPEEVVMTETASRRFAPQLRAMNMGFDPTTRSKTDSTVNVGDININIEGNKTPPVLIREIAEGIKREIRRGTIKFN